MTVQKPKKYAIVAMALDTRSRDMEKTKCQICSSEAEVGAVFTTYSEELDEVLVDKEHYCDNCWNKLKRGQNI